MGRFYGRAMGMTRRASRALVRSVTGNAAGDADAFRWESIGSLALGRAFGGREKCHAGHSIDDWGSVVGRYRHNAEPGATRQDRGRSPHRARLRSGTGSGPVALVAR